MNKLIVVLTLGLIAIMTGFVVDGNVNCIKRGKYGLLIVGMIILGFLFYTTIKILPYWGGV